MLFEVVSREPGKFGDLCSADVFGGSLPENELPGDLLFEGLDLLARGACFGAMSFFFVASLRISEF